MAALLLSFHPYGEHMQRMGDIRRDFHHFSHLSPSRNMAIIEHAAVAISRSDKLLTLEASITRKRRNESEQIRDLLSSEREDIEKDGDGRSRSPTHDTDR